MPEPAEKLPRPHLFLLSVQLPPGCGQLGLMSRAPSPACASAAAGSSTSPPCPTAALRRWSCTIRAASMILSPKLPQHTPTAQPQPPQPSAFSGGQTNVLVGGTADGVAGEVEHHDERGEGYDRANHDDHLRP